MSYTSVVLSLNHPKMFPQDPMVVRILTTVDLTRHNVIYRRLTTFDKCIMDKYHYTFQEEKKSDYDSDDDTIMKTFGLTNERRVFSSESVNATAACCSNGFTQLATNVNDSLSSDVATFRKKIQQNLAQTSHHRITGHVVRTLLLDVPLLIVLLTYAGVAWFSHVHDEYLVPQLSALEFTDKRSLRDNTYYSRECSADDMSTVRGAELFLPIDATPIDAYHHHLKHGFTVFQSILKPETCEKLRNFIVARNHEITEEEKIFVIEGQNRFSFGLGTEEVSVRNALMEIGNSPRLRPALEAILGPDPALIELTAITATNGAVAQWWHDDVISKGSPVQFGRAFGPSYSVFIQLQNTTKEMGATSCCPGTHFCSQGSMEQFCDEYGFQLVNDNGYWGQGDALLMNMNSWHRGGAHTDPDGLDRVMLILTFVPKPIERAETRQLSQGITFSLRWDMWGHTLNDLAHADTLMTQPWATLRALGLYKANAANWGIDYTSSALIRTANGDNGFRPEELEEFISRGGLRFLPKWLQTFDINWDIEESWPEYVKGTKEKCLAFFALVSKAAVVGYLLLFALCAVVMPRNWRARPASMSAAVLRVTLILSLVGLIYFAAKFHVDQTGWAKDIAAGRRYTSTVDVDRKFAKYPSGQTTLPTVNDVLIETRHGSEQLAMYNDFVTLGHPGNARFREMIDAFVDLFHDYNNEFKDATVQHVCYGIFQNHGRFLYQGPDGNWVWLYDDDVFPYVRAELAMASNKVLSVLNKNIRYIESEYKYGKLRNTALTVRHAVPYMESLRKEIVLKSNKVSSNIPSPKAKRIELTKIVRATNIPAMSRRPIRSKRVVQLQQEIESEEPFDGAWIAQDDEVETYNGGAWYYASVLWVNAHGQYSVEDYKGKRSVVDRFSIRPFAEYRIGERAQCFIPAHGSFETCKIEKVSPNDGLYTVTINRLGKTINLNLGQLRRRGERQRTKYQFKGPSYHDK